MQAIDEHRERWNRIEKLAATVVLDADACAGQAMHLLAALVLEDFSARAIYFDGWGRIYRRMWIHLHEAARSAGVTAGKHLLDATRHAAQQCWHSQKERVRAEQAVDDRLTQPLTRAQLREVLERINQRYQLAGLPVPSSTSGDPN